MKKILELIKLIVKRKDAKDPHEEHWGIGSR
jgi:hypothetical protein